MRHLASHRLTRAFIAILPPHILPLCAASVEPWTTTQQRAMFQRSDLMYAAPSRLISLLVAWPFIAGQRSHAGRWPRTDDEARVFLTSVLPGCRVVRVWCNHMPGTCGHGPSWSPCSDMEAFFRSFKRGKLCQELQSVPGSRHHPKSTS